MRFRVLANITYRMQSLRLSNYRSGMVFSPTTGLGAGYAERNARIRVYRCRCNNTSIALHESIVLHTCDRLSRRWCRNARGLGYSGTRIAGSGRPGAGEAQRVLRGDRPRFHPTLGRGTRMQGRQSHFAIFFFSFSQPSPWESSRERSRRGGGYGGHILPLSYLYLIRSSSYRDNANLRFAKSQPMPNFKARSTFLSLLSVSSDCSLFSFFLLIQGFGVHSEVHVSVCEG